MIEVIYKEETAEQDGVQETFSMPRNVRQIGLANGNYRIYVEDYVYTFLKRLSEEEKEQGKAAVLTGEIKWTEDMICVFVKGALAADEMEATVEHIDFSEEIWQRLQENKEKYFPDQEIVGWFFAQDLLVKTHLRYFGGEKILILMEPVERDEAFFRYDGGTMVKVEGYYIYYEKNPQMQNYMINTRRQNGVTPSEMVEDRAAKDFRSAVREKMEYKEQHQSSKFAYITSALLVLIVLVIGITTVNNFDKMKSVQTSLENLSKSMENGQTEEDTKTTTAAEAKEGAKEVSGTVKKSEEAKVSKEEESQLTDKDYYVVQKGETLAGISKKLYGDTSHVKAICKMNGLSDGNLIYIGQKLLLP